MKCLSRIEWADDDTAGWSNDKFKAQGEEKKVKEIHIKMAAAYKTK